ncbi:molybdopterin biosynthesis protein [Microaerobacter geothermalis]|uniref:molybdopterin biosynthesis protein n=1 Tax=Microaerobacter geothermalis TaxID=674972 RepID=UPI001F1D20DE|nr:molybdopterin biosynthesis protein [Microaerobacter geothermalis]MCF6092917.1 molybdopterin biosynthesis protein [Microaerobacter geothermalis]
MLKGMRKIYLEDTPLLQAKLQLMEKAPLERKVEQIPTQNARGRVTAHPIFAHLSMPHYHASAMDGIAVNAERTYGAHEQNPVYLERGKDFVYIDTGDPLPEGFDSVIMIENVQQHGEEEVEIIEPASPWQHVRQVGEDVISGEVIVPGNHRLRPVDLGAILAGGVTQIPVIKKPIAGIIPTGTELIPPSRELNKGEIIEFNGTVFSAYLEEWGAEPLYHGIVKDDYEAIKQAVLQMVEKADMVLLNAGSSAGSEDYTVHVIEEIGEVITHGVATRPGKPVVLGVVNGKPVIGLPGYPVSAYLALEWFVRPLIYQCYGLPEPKRPTLRATLGRRVVSVMGADEFVRMTIGAIDGKYVANPLTRAAGVTMSLVRADGLLVIPSNSLGYEQGEEVEIELYRSLDEINGTTVMSGSHDLTIDILGSQFHQKYPSRYLFSSHVGSMGGILAIRKGEAHVAGIHLFDEESGEYNIPFVKKMLGDQEVVLVNLVYRTQGWIVKRGNPLGIEKIEDLFQSHIRYINRQRGAGTRLLFDYLIKKTGLQANQLIGYDREAYSHLSVAAAVAGGSADCGLGIYSAAKAMDLDFIPVGEERYDLLMTRKYYESEAGQELLELIQSPSFQSEVESLGGYSMRDVGRRLL